MFYYILYSGDTVVNQKKCLAKKPYVVGLGSPI
jgi:hypothetical protein